MECEPNLYSGLGDVGIWIEGSWPCAMMRSILECASLPGGLCELARYESFCKGELCAWTETRLSEGKHKGRLAGFVAVFHRSYAMDLALRPSHSAEERTFLLRAKQLYDECSRHVRATRRRRVLARLRAAVRAVVFSQRLWRLADRRARSRFRQERDALLSEVSGMSLVVAAC
jgi:hypothetical protein